QGVCAQHGHKHEEDYARYWMHNGFLTMDAEKMSKSLGNVLLVHDLIKAYPGEVVRLALLSAHYRAPLDWNEGLLTQTRKTLDRLYGTLRDLNAIELPFSNDGEVQDCLVRVGFYGAVLDDLNTPAALSSMFSLVNLIRSAL